MSCTYHNYRKSFPEILTFLITNKCPCRCRFCFNWADTNPQGAIGNPKKQDLSLEEIRKIFQYFKPVEYIHLGGGEPFFRSDVGQILEIMAQYCRPRAMSISTNGQFVNSAVQSVRTFLSRCKKTDLTIKISIDGIGQDHDAIRQLPGAFQQAFTTYRALHELKKDFSRLHVGFNTVYSSLNQAKIFDLYLYLSTLSPKPDCMSLLLVRGHSRESASSENLDMERYRMWTDMYGKDMLEDKFESDFATRIATWLMHRSIYETKTTNSRQIHCYAGIVGAFIDNEGKVGGCETQESYGSLRENDYDFGKIWFSEKAQNLRRKTYETCFCTNEPQWWHPSVRYNRTIFKKGAQLCWIFLQSAIQGYAAALKAKFGKR